MDPQLREMPLSHRLFWSYLADDLIASGRDDDAERQLRNALARGPDVALMNRLGQIYFLRGRLRDAEVCFQQGVAWDPSDHGPHLGLSKIALQRRQTEAGLRHLTQATLLAPQDLSVLYSLALVYRQLGRQADAARVQDTIRQLREIRSGASTTPDGHWPMYAL
jgi:Flp pilus assembly protein TadD